MLCIASNTCTASVVEICSSDAVITVVLIYEIQEVGENILCKYLDNSLLEDSFSLNPYNNSLLKDSFSCQGHSLARARPSRSKERVWQARDYQGQNGFDQEYKFVI